MDLLGSILGTMTGPPKGNEKEREEKRKAKELNKKIEEKRLAQAKVFRQKIYLNSVRNFIRLYFI